MINSFKDYFIGEKVIVIERTYLGDIFEWEGEIMDITDYYIETKHSRNPITHPQWMAYFKAYSDTWTKHYGIDNIKKKK